jgi:hypothetical protein
LGVVLLTNVFVPSLTKVQTGQIGQVISSVVLTITFPLVYRYFPETPPRRKRKPNTSLLWQGFQQNYETCKAISKNHKPLKWFLITVVLAEAGTTPLVPVMITVTSQVWAYDAGAIGTLFFIALLGTIPGVTIASMLCRRCNAQIALRNFLLLFAIGTLTATFVMEATKHERGSTSDNNDDNDTPTYIGFIFSGMWGLLLGGFFTIEQVYFSACLPPEQETELSGFYVYCTIILTWVPTLIGSVMLEAGTSAAFILLPLVGFQFLAFVSACCCPSWNDVLAAAKEPLRLSTTVNPNEMTARTDEEIMLGGATDGNNESKLLESSDGDGGTWAEEGTSGSAALDQRKHEHCQ